MSSASDFGEAPFEIGVDALRDMLQAAKPIQLVDIRDDWERRICAIDGSIDIALGELPSRVDELSPEIPVLVICHHGMRSFSAARWLRDLGFHDAASVEGGIDAWARLVDPAMARY